MVTCKRVQEQGFTLVELLVAMTLALLVIAGIGQIYTAAKRSYDVQTSLGRLQEVGRYAVDVISEDVRRAGYWGITYMRAITPTGTTPPDGSCTVGGTTWGSMVTRRIYGLNNSSAGYACITDQAGSGGDVLVVRYAGPRAMTAGALYDAQRLYIRSAPFDATVTQGQPAATSLTTTDRFFDYPIRAHAYYVRQTAYTPCSGSAATISVPELARKFLNENGNPETQGLVHGVERLQVQYGLDTDAPVADTDGTGNPRRSVNLYLNANQITPAEWDTVVSVRFWVLVRDECPQAGYSNTNTYMMGDVPFTPAAGDGYRRQLYTATMALRN